MSAGKLLSTQQSPPPAAYRAFGEVKSILIVAQNELIFGVIPNHSGHLRGQHQLIWFVVA